MDAQVWKQANILNNLLEIDLSCYPEGNVIMKHSVQNRTLTGGQEKVYEYDYMVADEYGKGQVHLPMKNKKPNRKEGDWRWKLCDDILYRRDIEQRIEAAREGLENAIQVQNTKKRSDEPPETVEHVLEQVRNAADKHKEHANQKKTHNRNPKFDIDGTIVTNLGEGVRSKNECIFANKLQEMEVPYLYEMEIRNVALPDFAVFINEKLYIIELLGKMNEKEYRQAQSAKIEKYAAAGICMGKNLVLIDVTRGISTPILEKIIQDLIAGRVPRRIVQGYTTEEYEKKMKRILEYESHHPD